MSFKIIYHPEVLSDIRNAVDWYNGQQNGLGDRFHSTIKEHLDFLKNSASGFAIRYDEVHCMPIRKFPYMVHYRIDITHKIIKVEAILNTNRDHRKWGERKS
jgi:hypothetical protein